MGNLVVAKCRNLQEYKRAFPEDIDKLRELRTDEIFVLALIVRQEN